jgi:hypothetical protein
MAPSDSTAMCLYIPLALLLALSSSSDLFVCSYPLASQSMLNCLQLSLLFNLSSTLFYPALVDITAFVDITFFALPTNMRRRQSCRQSCRQSSRQLVDSSLDEYELTDSETEYHSGLETEPTDVDGDVDEVIEDVQDVDGLDCAYLLADEVYLPEYYLKQMEEFDESEFTT